MQLAPSIICTCVWYLLPIKVINTDGKMAKSALCDFSDKLAADGTLLLVSTKCCPNGTYTTGPPCSVIEELLLDCMLHDVIAWPARVQPPAGPPWSVTDNDDRRRQTSATFTSLALYTMCRRASNNHYNTATAECDDHHHLASPPCVACQRVYVLPVLIIYVLF